MRTYAIVVGTAGWSLPKATAPAFPSEGSHLLRYATTFGGVEINSSFYRPHRASTYAKWSASVSPSFAFPVKLPRAITHERALANVDDLLDAFLDQVSGLGAALGPLLVQLPPKAAFDRIAAEAFFALLRRRHAGPVVIEPRHASWFSPEVNALLTSHRVSGVAADPARVPAAAVPFGDMSTVYYRLHGSPVVYRSRYDAAYLARLARLLESHRECGAQVWCIFDNTTLGAATANALELVGALGGNSMLVPPGGYPP